MLNRRFGALSIAIGLAIAHSGARASEEGLPVKSPAECLASGPKATAAGCLVQNAQSRFILCSFSMNGIRLGLKPSPECALAGPGRLTEHYEATVASFSANPAAQSMTKDYYAFWLSAMGSLMPGSEREAVWRARVDKMQFELTQMGNRLKLEK